MTQKSPSDFLVSSLLRKELGHNNRLSRSFHRANQNQLLVYRAVIMQIWDKQYQPTLSSRRRQFV